MIDIEIKDDYESSSSCPDCGYPIRTVWGYVYQDGDAHAVYYASWTPNHREHGVELIVSVGGWGEGAVPSKKRSVALKCRMGHDRPQFMVIDANESPWAKEAILGKMLTREEAFAAKITEEVFPILDRIVEIDGRFRSFLGASGAGSNY